MKEVVRELMERVSLECLPRAGSRTEYETLLQALRERCPDLEFDNVAQSGIEQPSQPDMPEESAQASQPVHPATSSQSARMPMPPKAAATPSTQSFPTTEDLQPNLAALNEQQARLSEQNNVNIFEEEEEKSFASAMESHKGTVKARHSPSVLAPAPPASPSAEASTAHPVPQ